MSTQHNNWRKKVGDYSLMLTIIAGISTTAFVVAGYDIMTMFSDAKTQTEVLKHEVSLPLSENVVQEQVMPTFEQVSESKPSQVEIEKSEAPALTVDVKPELEKEPAAEVYNYKKQKSRKVSNLESFVAVCSNQVISITWITESKIAENFQLEVSSDNVNFEPYSEKAKVVSLDNKNYYRLKIPESSTESKYFRLKKMAVANRVEFSDVTEASCLMSNNDPEIDVYPVGNGKFKVVVNAKIKDHFRVVMTDMNETELVSDEFNVKEGSNEFVFKSGTLPRGNYNLKVTNGNITSQKIVAIK